MGELGNVEHSHLHSHPEHSHHPGPSDSKPGASLEELKRAATFFRAAGDPARLQLLEHLGRGEACVGDMATVFKVKTSTLSQRLRVLRDVGLVSRRREGKHVFYALADSHVDAIISAAIEHAQET